MLNSKTAVDPAKPAAKVEPAIKAEPAKPAVEEGAEATVTIDPSAATEGEPAKAGEEPCVETLDKTCPAN